jgi:hypothetical protein
VGRKDQVAAAAVAAVNAAAGIVAAAVVPAGEEGRPVRKDSGARWPSRNTKADRRAIKSPPSRCRSRSTI